MGSSARRFPPPGGVSSRPALSGGTGEVGGAAGPAVPPAPVVLAEAMLRVLRWLSPRRGGVVVLEDMHWADRETLAVLEYLATLTALGHRLMAGLALSLGLEESYFADHGTGEPLTLFRILNYPPPADATLWGVGEHTDYGLLTLLLQDDAGGLEVKSRSR